MNNFELFYTKHPIESWIIIGLLISCGLLYLIAQAFYPPDEF